jgi:hypothetical protein
MIKNLLAIILAIVFLLVSFGGTNANSAEKKERETAVQNLQPPPPPHGVKKYQPFLDKCGRWKCFDDRGKPLVYKYCCYWEQQDYDWLWP